MSRIFTGVRAKWLPLYEELKVMIERKVGAFEVRETSSAILWRHSSTFAEVSAKSSCMVVAFASDTVRDEWKPVKTLQTSKNRVVHYFEVTDNRLFPVLVERIAVAYALTKSKKGPNKSAEKAVFTTIDEYIAQFSEQTQAILCKVRKIIRENAPGAIEKISYGMPCFWQGENLIYFAAMKGHLGIYPTNGGVTAFADRLAGYKTSKGAIQFPWDKDIPYDLIADITRFRVKEAEKNRNYDN